MLGSSQSAKEQKQFDNLEEYPDVVSSPHRRPVMVVGDLNGSVLFAIKASIENEILSLSDDPNVAVRQYAAFVRIYKLFNKAIVTNDKVLARQCITQFKNILSEATFNERAQIFVGDTVADRGGLTGSNRAPYCEGNDYLTLYFFYKLLLSGKGQHSKTASNHDAMFFCAWQKYLDDGVRDSRLDYGQYPSAIYFIQLIDRGFVTLDEVKKLVDAHKRSTKLFDYIHDEEAKTFELIVHAPCGLETVWATAKYYKLDPSDFGLHTWDLTEDFAKTLPVAVIKSVIDHVNQKFLDVLLNDPREFEKYTLEVAVNKEGDFIATALDHPVTRAMFNRAGLSKKTKEITDKEEEKRLITPGHIENGAVKCSVSHGHDEEQNVRKNMVNYNNHVGKAASHSLIVIPPTATKSHDVQNGIGSRLPVVLPPKPKTTVAALPKAFPPPGSASVRPSEQSTVAIHLAAGVAQSAEFKIKRSELTVFNEQREQLYALLETQQQNRSKNILEKAEEISRLMTSPGMENFLSCLEYNPLEDSILTIKIAEISPLSLVPFFGRQLDILMIDDQVMKAAIDAVEKLTPPQAEAPQGEGPQAEAKSQENFAALIPQTLTLLKEIRGKALLTEIVDDYELKATEDKAGRHSSLAKKVASFKESVEDKAFSVEKLVYEKVLDTTAGFGDSSLNTLFLKKLATDPFLRTMLRIPGTIDLSSLETPDKRRAAAKQIKSVLKHNLETNATPAPTTPTTHFTQSFRLLGPRI